MNLFLSLLLFFYKFNLFRRIVPSIIRKFYSKKNHEITINNFKITLNVGSSIDREIFLKKIYDKDKFDYFEKKINLNDFDYFIDVGSYIGYYSLYLSSKYKNLKVISFEPITESFNLINKSKKINNLNNLELNNYALSNIEGETKFWVTDNNKKSGYSFFKKDDFNNELKNNNYNYNNLIFRNIKTRIFDNIYTIKKKKIFIKIDVERHEFEALLGCKNFLKYSDNLIFLQIEIVDRLENKVLDLLKSYNFKQINRIYPTDKRGGCDFYLTNYNL